MKLFPIGSENTPVSIGPFHKVYGDEEQQYHTYCELHEDFGTCENNREDAKAVAQAHLNEFHGEFNEHTIDSDKILINAEDLEQEILYRLSTVAAHGLMRGKHSQIDGTPAELAEGFLEEQIKSAMLSLRLKSSEIS